MKSGLEWRGGHTFSSMLHRRDSVLFLFVCIFTIYMNIYLCINKINITRLQLLDFVCLSYVCMYTELIFWLSSNFPEKYLKKYYIVIIHFSSFSTTTTRIITNKLMGLCCFSLLALILSPFFALFFSRGSFSSYTFK